MNSVHFQSPHPMPHWSPMLPPDPPRSSVFWNTNNASHQLKELQDTLNLAKSMEKELEALMMLRDGKGATENAEQGSVAEFLRYLEDGKMDLEHQATLSVEAANLLMSKLSAQLDPFRFVVDENSPWEERSSVVGLVSKMQKSKRNKLWRKRKRQCVAQERAKEHEQFEQANREADEWRARKMAKDMANRKVEEMKAIEKVKAKRERKRLEPELELALIVEELQKLRSLRIEKLKKQGYFLPEEDDKFFESVRAAVEQEENQAQSSINTDGDNDVATAEEPGKNTESDVPIRDNETSEDMNEGSSTALDIGKKGQENVANLPLDFYHYYYGSDHDISRLIEVRREWDAYIRHGGSRIPGHWVLPSPPANEIWASYMVKPNGNSG
ncbi:PREDICTED: U11/U12 small nuclear ribonucleoprotein 59 kDa protein [Tarenaya hassleriana]|uniref:U11/U12 small nuclear ribonucleoprotein 59 kDa protein n=1 Tax=Tarenaya hassleriana TaxID=28532 RepID=UPI00053C10DF|nr:PREDICTED: U11/U12 small nuclear ribonucleoprotein 59 kDa protein [Tarenaya hassleriana]